MIADDSGIRYDLMEEAREKVRNSLNMDKLAQIKILAEKYPNDLEFGTKVRELLNIKY